MNKVTAGKNGKNGISPRMGRRIGQTTGIEVEYFCRACKGHYSRTVPIASFWNTACRCGSTDLLVYSLAGEVSAPLRAN